MGSDHGRVTRQWIEEHFSNEIASEYADDRKPTSVRKVELTYQWHGDRRLCDGEIFETEVEFNMDIYFPSMESESRTVYLYLTESSDGAFLGAGGEPF